MPIDLALTILFLFFILPVLTIITFVWLGCIFLEWLLVNEKPLFTIFMEHVKELGELRIV